jgi:hypothetical protein
VWAEHGYLLTILLFYCKNFNCLALVSPRLPPSWGFSPQTLGSIFKKLLHQKTFILLRSAQVTKIDFREKLSLPLEVLAILWYNILKLYCMRYLPLEKGDFI